MSLPMALCGGTGTTEVSSIRHATDGFPTLSRIFVIDDEPDVRDLLVQYFRDRGHSETVLSAGRAAINEIEQNPDRYTLIVSDCNSLVRTDLPCSAPLVPPTHRRLC
jgi:hypothetical protein